MYNARFYKSYKNKIFSALKTVILHTKNKGFDLAICTVLFAYKHDASLLFKDEKTIFDRKINSHLDLNGIKLCILNKRRTFQSIDMYAVCAYNITKW